MHEYRDALYRMRRGERDRQISRDGVLGRHKLSILRTLVAGRQDITDGLAGLRYGQGVTDGCIGWDGTVDLVGELAPAVAARRQRRA